MCDSLDCQLLRDECDALHANVQRLRDANRWIPMAEREPEMNDEVMVYYWDVSRRSHRFDVVRWLRGREWKRSYSHWRPLPDPPKAAP